MNAPLFFISMALSVIGPILAVAYLRPILERVLRGLCDADGGAQFWTRCAFVLAITGTLLLSLTFGQYGDETPALYALQRTLWLVACGVFATVAFISRNVWSQVRALLAARRAAEAVVGAEVRS
jgi:hypothetical protein